jgi:hypothetical protein
MAMTRDVIVQFITKLNDKGIKSATKSTEKFGGVLGAISKTGIAAYAALSAASIKFAQVSVKNALADEKAQRILSLSLKNSAGASEAVVTAAESQIDKMQRLTGVSDDQLRPALSRIVRSTSEVTTAFDLLDISVNIAKATQKDLGSVANAVSKAVDGNFVSLQKLGVGLDKDILATKDFNKIFGELRRNFAGFAAAEADTVEGKIARLKVAADEASEVIGGALIESFTKFASSEGGIEGATKKMDGFAAELSKIITGIGELGAATNKFVAKTNKLLGIQIDLYAYELIPIVGRYIKALRDAGEAAQTAASIELSNLRQVTSARNAERQAEVDRKKALDDFVKGLKAEEAKQRAAAKAAADRAKQEKLAALEKAKSQRDEFLQKQLAKQFDTDAIGLQVALSRKLSDEDKTRVNALIALQEDDVTKQMNALAELNNLYTAHYAKRIADLGKVTAATKEANDAAFAGFITPRPTGTSVAEDTTRPTPSMASIPSDLSYIADFSKAITSMTPEQFDKFNFGMGAGNLGATESLAAFDYTAESFTGGANAPNVYVTVEGSVLTQGQDLGFYIANLIGDLNRQGNPVTLANLGR